MKFEVMTRNQMKHWHLDVKTQKASDEKWKPYDFATSFQKSGFAADGFDK